MIAPSAWVPSRAPVIGVLGGCGGAGASTLAVALSLSGVARGDRVLLVDADPLGGGLDLLLSAEDQPGLRWPDLSALRGSLPPGLLAEGLPRAGPLPFLTWPRPPLRPAPVFADPFLTDPPGSREGEASERTHLPPEALTSVLATARADLDLVVLDLPRTAAAETLTHLDALVLVLPATLRATAAARALLAALPSAPNPHLVVRAAPADLPPPSVASALGLPLAATLRPDPRLADALATAGTPGAATSATCHRILDEVARELA